MSQPVTGIPASCALEYASPAHQLPLPVDLRPHLLPLPGISNGSAIPNQMHRIQINPRNTGQKKTVGNILRRIYNKLAVGRLLNRHMNFSIGVEIFIIGRQETGCLIGRQAVRNTALSKASELLEAGIVHTLEPAKCIFDNLCPKLTFSKWLSTAT